MKKVKFFTKFISVGMLYFTLETLGIPVAQAQRPVFLLDLTCVDRGGNYRQSSRDISVGREIYTSVMFISPGSAFTCKLPTASSASLRLEYGMSDTASDRAPVTITVYLDGNEVASKTAAPGKTGTLLVDISKGKSLAIETTCARASNCGAPAYFFKAQVEPAAASPGRRQ